MREGRKPKDAKGKRFMVGILESFTTSGEKKQHTEKRRKKEIEGKKRVKNALLRLARSESRHRGTGVGSGEGRRKKGEQTNRAEQSLNLDEKKLPEKKPGKRGAKKGNAKNESNTTHD